jgi:hypothetical protein
MAPKREMGIATAIIKVDLIEPRNKRTISEARIVPSKICS